MVVWLREAMDAAQTDAEAVQPDPALSPQDPIEFILNGPDITPPATEAAERHVRRHAPAVVLHRIAADRKQLAEHSPVPDHGRFSHSYGEKCPAFCEGECRDEPKVCLACRDSSGDPIEAPCKSLENLAEGYGWTEETT
jgi:hypothetical protein